MICPVKVKEKFRWAAKLGHVDVDAYPRAAVQRAMAIAFYYAANGIGQEIAHYIPRIEELKPRLAGRCQGS